MKILNKYGKVPCAIHANGCVYTENELNGLFDMIDGHDIKCPDNVQIIIAESNLDDVMANETLKRREILPFQLNNNGINFINGAFETPDGFSFVYKINYIYNALQKVNTEYVFFLDTRDTKIITMDGIIEKFLAYDTKVLFCADTTNYPTLTLGYDVVHNVGDSPFRYLNSGGFFARTADALDIFGKFTQIQQILGKTILFQWIEMYNCTAEGTDQGFIRMLLDAFTYRDIEIDYRCDIFQPIYGVNVNLY